MYKIGTKVYPLTHLMDICEDIDVKDIYGIVTGIGFGRSVTWLSTKCDNPITLFKSFHDFDEHNLTTNRNEFLNAYKNKYKHTANEMLYKFSPYFKSEFAGKVEAFLKNEPVTFNNMHYDPLKDELVNTAISYAQGKLTDEEILNICLNDISEEERYNINQIIYTTVSKAVDIFIDAKNASTLSNEPEVVEDVNEGTQEGTTTED